MPQLTLASNQEDGEGLIRLSFTETLPAFSTPGQFVTVHVEGHKPAYFALASVPGSPVELLVKVHGDAAEALAAAQPGAVFEVSEPIGNGFTVDPKDARPLVIFATGSGLSGVRSVIQAEVDRGLPRPVTLLYGVYTPNHASFHESLAAWKDAGVAVHLVVSEPTKAWSGLTGFVQQAAQELGLVTPGVTVVLCGYPAMVEEVRSLYADAGAAPGQLLTNF